MLKLIFSMALAFVVSASYSQDNFTRFVESRKVRFALYLADTFHFSQPNISLLVREKFARGSVKASLPLDALNTRKTVFVKPAIIRERIAPNQETKVVDEDGNVTATIKESEDPLLSSRYFDEQTKDMLEVPQVLYIESGHLRSYIPYFSVKYSVFTSWGQKLGVSNGFNTGFNKDRSLPRAVKKKSKLIASIQKTLRLDTATQQIMLKQLFSQNLLQSLWSSLHKKQFEIYRLDSMVRVPFEKLNMGLISQVNVPVYDAEGKLESNNKYPMDNLPLLPDVFSEIRFQQNWYYNEKKNILFCDITELLLYPNSNFEMSKSGKPALKIVIK